MSAVLTMLRVANRYRELKRSQYWSEQELASYTKAHLDETLRAAVKTRFYAGRFGDAPRAEDFTNLPILRRSEVRALNDSVLSLYPRGSRFSSDSSSGSTGMPAEFLFDASHQLGRFAVLIRFFSTPFPRISRFCLTFLPKPGASSLRSENSSLAQRSWRIRSDN